MLYKLRRYHMHPDHLAAIHKRFSEVTLDLYKRHGIKVATFLKTRTVRKPFTIWILHQQTQNRPQSLVR